MPKAAGELSVEYVVISDAAVRRLERLQKQFDKVGDSAEKQGKKTQDSYKKNAKAMAVYGAAAMGMLYGLIKASSYASMWMDQLGHSMTRISNIIMEKLGLKNAVDFLVGALGLLADELEKPEKTDFWSNLADDFGDMSIKSQIATLAIIALGGALLLLGIGLGILGISSFVTLLGGIAAAGGAGAAAVGILTMAFAVLAGLILGGIVVFILWKTGILDGFRELGAKFGVMLSKAHAGYRMFFWLLRKGFDNWVAETKVKFETFKMNIGKIFDGIWSYIIGGLTSMKNTFIGIITTLINKVAALITKILSIPKIPWGSSGGSSGFGTTPKSERKGDWGSSATGGHVLRTGAQMVHQGEDIVNLRKVMSGVRSDSGRGDITINPVINISTNGGMSDPFEANRIADLISKRMGEEVRRISTSI